MKREDFMLLAKKVDFANEILKYNCKSMFDSVSALGEFTELNLDQVIGTDDSRNILTTWFDFLDGMGGGRFLPKDFEGSVHEQANKAEESLIHEGCKIIMENNLCYISDGHNRLAFLKFYKKIFKLNSITINSKDIYIISE